MNVLFSILFMSGMMFCSNCIKINSDTIVSTSSLILTFLGVVLSYLAIKQTLKAREDIAYNQSKIKQVDAISNLLRHLNQKKIKIYVLKIGDDCQVIKQKHYICNIFELGTLLKDTKSIWESIEDNAPVFLSVESDSILDADSFQTDGFVDDKISNALSAFNSMFNSKKLDFKESKGQTFIIMQTRTNPNSMYGTTSLPDVLEIQNYRVNNVESLWQSVFELKTTISDWYKRNKISNCNICIDPNNITPIVQDPKEN